MCVHVQRAPTNLELMASLQHADSHYGETTLSAFLSAGERYNTDPAFMDLVSDHFKKFGKDSRLTQKVLVAPCFRDMCTAERTDLVQRINRLPSLRLMKKGETDLSKDEKKSVKNAKLIDPYLANKAG